VSRWRYAVTLVVLAGACSNLTSGSEGVVALELQLPAPAIVEQHDTLTLHAVALNAQGDSLATPVYWRTLDDSILTIVDSTGLVTSDTTTGLPRVQAYVGSLRSEIQTLTILPRADTLRLTGADTVTVAAADSVSDTLGVVVESDNPAGGITGTSILFQVVDSVAARGTVEFVNGASGLLVYRATTGLSGGPSPGVALRRIAGRTPPASVQVQVSATRPSGRAVPGSGQIITVLFQ